MRERSPRKKKICSVSRQVQLAAGALLPFAIQTGAGFGRFFATLQQMSTKCSPISSEIFSEAFGNRTCYVGGVSMRQLVCGGTMTIGCAASCISDRCVPSLGDDIFSRRGGNLSRHTALLDHFPFSFSGPPTRSSGYLTTAAVTLRE